MDDASDSSIVRFGLFEADLRSGELRFGGAKVRLQELPFRALVLLARRAGQVVTRQELAAALWPDGIHVDFEQGIHTAIKKLRQALRDSPARPRWIETVGRRGYRFIGEIERESRSAPSPGARRAPAARARGPAPPAFVPGLTPFVGRETERRLLQERFDAASGGDGQVVLVTGEAGIGKSRLALELATDLGGRRHAWLACRGSPQHTNTPFHPILELLGQSPAETSERLEYRWDELSRPLALTGVKPAEGLPLVSALLGLAAGNAAAPLPVSPGEARRKLLATLAAWLVGLARLEPLVVVFEDLHWIDRSTLELLGILSECGASAPLLLLLTARPEFRFPWPLLSHHSHLTLSRLGRGQVEEMVRSLAPAGALSDDVVKGVVERTEGVPLYVEELTKAVLEAGSELRALREIPASVRSSLLARLDRLGPAREVAQVGAAIGREFSWSLVRAVSELPGERLEPALARLVDAELVYQRGVPPEATYLFEHALVQQAAYQSLLESQRRDIHGRIVDALEKHFPERVAREHEIMARHCDAAGRAAQAIVHYQRAGESAIQASANEEAIGQLRRALELLATLPEARERDRQEFQLQMAIAEPLSTARGFPHPECEGAFDRARALASRMGKVPEWVRVLVGLATSYRDRGDFAAATKFANEALQAAERTGGAFDLLSAHYAVGGLLSHQGELSQSLHHLEQAVARYEFEEHASLAHKLGRDLGVQSRGFAAWCHVRLGHPDRGLEMSQEAVALARRVKHPPSLAFALAAAGVTHWFRREPIPAEERTDEAIALAVERGLPVYLGIARTIRGWARAMTQGDDEGLAEIRRGISELEQSQVRIALPLLVNTLVETLWKFGRHDEALAALDLGAARGIETGAHSRDAELHRLRAEILLGQDGGPSKEAEDLLHRALAIAREQGAKWWELRAARSLARLLRDHGRHDEAHALLQPVYAWFTEGFDTPDLKDAKALLDEL